MKISELIQKLEAAKQRYGDLDVVAEAEREFARINEVELNPNFFGESVIYLFDSESS